MSTKAAPEASQPAAKRARVEEDAECATQRTLALTARTRCALEIHEADVCCDLWNPVFFIRDLVVEARPREILCP